MIKRGVKEREEKSRQREVRRECKEKCVEESEGEEGCDVREERGKERKDVTL